MKTDRKVVFWGFAFFCVLFVILATSASGDSSTGRIEKVTAQLESGQKVYTWAKLDSGRSVIEAGVTIPYEVFERPAKQPGKGPAGSIAVLPFPEIVRNSTFLNHFELNWEMHGHEPPVFMVPHFDFHFYSVPVTDVTKVVNRDPQPPEGALIPAGYVYPGREFSVPQMGVHAFRPADLERPFTDVLIFGFYSGKMTFIEPMITRDRLLEKKNLAYEIPVPGSLGATTRYPTKVNIRYDGKSNAYHLIFSAFMTAGLSL